jgi:hypothetical protein
MNRVRVFIATALVLGAQLMLQSPVSAQTQNAGGPGEWLSQFTGSRSLGLGGAYVATADDPLGILWNPAGMSFMNQNEVRFENAQLFENTSINSFGFAVPGSRWPSFGVAIVSLGSSDFERTNELNDALGTFREGETAYLLSASKSLSPRLAIGVNAKLVQQSVESFSANGFGADLGAMFDLTSMLRVGASVMNLGGPSLTLRDVAESYPTQMRGGFSLRAMNGRALMTAEVDQTQGLGARLHGGAEYWIQSGLALRMGWSDDGGSGGITYRFTPQYEFEYAAANHPLGLTHRFGISYRFGGFFASSQASPSVFSPTGDQAVTRIALNSRTKAQPHDWSVQILNKSDEVVRRFGGSGQPPAHLEWDGKSESGLPLPDGTYRFSLVVKDDAGRVVAGPVHIVEISTGGPQGTVPLIPQADNGATK